MKTYSFCMPILEGMADQLREEPARWLRDERDAWRRSREAAGIARERAWIQHTPEGPIAVFAHDIEDLDQCFEVMAHSVAPFDVRFREHVRAVHGVDLARDPAPSITQLAAWTDVDVSDDVDDWALAMRVRDGSQEQVAEWARNVWEHPEYEDSRRAAGVQQQVLCWHETPTGAFVVLYAEGEGLRRAANAMAMRLRDVDRLWMDGIERFAGLHVEGFSSLPRLERVVDVEVFQHAHT